MYLVSNTILYLEQSLFGRKRAEGFSLRVAGTGKGGCGQLIGVLRTQLCLFTKNYTAIDFYPDRANYREQVSDKLIV